MKTSFFIMLWFMGAMLVFTLTCIFWPQVVGQPLLHLVKRLYNVVERNWRGHTAWISSLADAWGKVEQSKHSAPSETKISMEKEEKVESGGTDRFLEKLEWSKVSLITVDCAWDGNRDKFCSGLQKVVLLGTEDDRFGLAAEYPWMGVSRTTTAENGDGEALRGRGLDGIWSDNVWEQLQCRWKTRCGFYADMLSGTLGRLDSRCGSSSSSGRWTKGFKRHNERWSPFGSLCFRFHM